MKIRITFKHRWAVWLFLLPWLFLVALPFTWICMALVSDSPFWMWEFIFMFFGGIFIWDAK